MADQSRSSSVRPTPSFNLTTRQALANELLASDARHVLLYGGARSGKTFILCRAVIIRALRAPGSSHAILRYRLNHLKLSVILDTMPKVLRTCFPGVKAELNRTDWILHLPNGSRVMFGGLDDKVRTEKILGQEHSTVYLNECSQITYDARNKLVTRLAQRSGLTLRAYYDANPPTTDHWTYRLFIQKVEPKSGEALARPDNYQTMQMNPVDNAHNLGDGFIAELESMPERDRRRFLLGEFQSSVEGALWHSDRFLRVAKEQLPTMRRVVVAVDPSGCSGSEDVRSDEVGIVVAGLGSDDNGYVLEDLSGRMGPTEWARASLDALARWDADRIVAEQNFGGAMVESTIRAVDPNAPFKAVVASRGKAARAEPVSALYEKGRVFHLGRHVDLENQLCAFSYAGYQGARSPDRADAAVWCLTELMLSNQDLAIHEFYRQEAARIRAGDVPEGMVRMRAGPGASSSVNTSDGRMINVGADGCVTVPQRDMSMLLRVGFTTIEA